MSVANDMAYSFALAKGLEQSWEREHDMLMSEECQVVQPASPMPPCLSAGVCICSANGERLRRRADKFVNYLKKFCPNGSDRKSLSAEGWLVVKLFSVVADIEAVLSEDLEWMKEVFAHIGLVSLSPYAPQFMIVEQVEDPAEVVFDRKRIYVKSLVRFCGLYELFAELAHFDKIEATFFDWRVPPGLSPPSCHNQFRPLSFPSALMGCVSGLGCQLSCGRVQRAMALAVAPTRAQTTCRRT